MADEEFPAPSGPAPGLAVAAAVREGVLQVDLEVSNDGAAPVYLLDGLWHWDTASKAHVPPPSPAYVALRDDGSVHLLLGIPPLPKSRRVGQRIVPFATRLEAGGRFQRRLELPLPVREYNPYFPPAAGTAWQGRAADSLVVTLHFVDALDGLTEAETSLEGKLQVHHPRLLAEVRILSATLQTPTFTAQRQLGDFERF